MANGQDKILAIVCVLLLILSIGYFYLTTTPSEDLVLKSTRDYTNGNTNKYITAENLYELIYDSNVTNDPYIISIRNAENYSNGHIPGAVNIGLSSLFDKENFETLPKDKTIVVYCFTGHTASQATALLNVNGFDAYSLKWGMCSWTDNDSVAANKYFTGGAGYDVVSDTSGGATFSQQYPIEKMPVKIEPLKPVACGGDDLPTTPADGTDSTEDETSDVDAETLREASDTAATSTHLEKYKYVIKASELNDLLNDGDATNDPYIIDLRVKQEDKPDYYVEGHIKGAVNIGLESLFNDDNLEKIPKDKLIVTICYTGHTASQTAALLKLNGYTATTLMWGMCGWSTDVNVLGSYCFNKSTACMGYDISQGIWDESTRESIYDSLNPIKTVAITATSLYDNLWDGDTTNDPFILSIRNSTSYQLGHIPTAVNYGGITSLFTNINLAKLPIDRQIVVVCYTGHTASQATALLNTLGFNATSLKWGMVGWCANTTIAPKGFTRTSPNYPIITGTEPGTIEDAAEAEI